ncbi:hypothetical protein [Nesterenkonia ebinurensis]|uniref:hypothetical protein n=1 Tax=Nesterenkonia ebinurensis TaxID=2608252 RepID=UPI00123C99DC|nr:hypothetical protein [Nesterenkonia ebinurensis]
MTWFILIALGFSVILMLAVIFDGVLDAVNLDFGGDGILSATTMSAAVAGFGYGGWIAMAGFDASMGAAVGVGLGVAVLIALIAAKSVRLIRRAETPGNDPEEKIGRTGTAITGAAAGDPFEFSLVHRGQPRKLTAVADEDVSPGEALTIEAVLSPSRMKVTKT